MVKALALTVYRSIPTSSGIPYKDLFAIGWIALLQADRKYSPDHGANLATYARRRVYGALLDYLREQDVCGRTTRHRINKLKESREWLRHELRREPTQEELSEHSGITLKQMRSAYAKASEIISLESVAAHSQRIQRFYIDPTPDPEEQIAIKQTRLRLASAVRALSKKQQQVIKLRYSDNLSLREIAKELDRHESRVCQIHAEAIAILRRELKPIKAL